MRWLLILCTFACCLPGYAQVYPNPSFDRVSFEVLHPHVDKVVCKNDSTIVYCTIDYQESWGYSIPKTMYIEDIISTKKYQIVQCEGLPFEPEERQFTYGGSFQFSFIFPKIDGLRYFNLIECPTGKGFFNIYGINLNKCNTIKYNENEYKHFKNMSDFYKSSGDINKFVEFEEQELSSAQYIFGMRSFAADACYIQLAHYYNEVGDYRKAIDLGIQALECDSIQLGVENKEYPVYANTLGSLSQFYLNAGKETESLHCLQKCIRIRRNIGDEKGYLNELLNLLLTGHSNDGILKRIAIVNQELETLPNFIENTSLPIASIYKEIAFSYSLLDDNKNAIKYCDKALAIMDGNRYNDNEDYAELLGLKCKYQQRSGLKDEAISSGTAAKLLYESLNIRSLKYAELLGDLARTYVMTLNFEKSIQLQTIAAGIYENAKDWISLAEAYNNIGFYYQSTENLDDAERNIKKAIDVLNEHDNAQQYIDDEVELTGHNMINNPFVLASINQRINTDKAGSYQELARIYQKKGDFTNAINTELKNGAIIQSMGDDQLYAVHLQNLSQYYLSDKQYGNAINCSKQSLRFLSDNDSTLKTRSNLNLAYIYNETGDISKAIQCAKEATSLSKFFTEESLFSHSMLALLYFKNQEYKDAENCLSGTLDFLKDYINNSIFEMTKEQKQRLWDKYEYYFLFYRNIIEKLDSKSLLTSKLYDYVLFSKSLLLDSDIYSSENDISQLKITWKDIQHILSTQDIAIEFIRTPDDKKGYSRYHALVIDRNCSFPQLITLYSESDLEKIKETDKRNIQDIVGELIWKPITEQYRQIENIYFSPDGILHILPIEYYKVDSIRNMFEYYNMFRISSTKELVRCYKTQERLRAALFGGLDYSPYTTPIDNNSYRQYDILRGISERGGFEPLFNTLEEIKEISSQLKIKNIPTTVYSGNDGTETTFKMLSNTGISMIHLATHGMYIEPSNLETKKQSDNFNFLELLSNEEDPVKEDIKLTHSFLVMSGGNRLLQREHSLNNEDGILTAKEISQMDLHGLDLVVLSACETARGDVENSGVYGLQRGFKKAGANTILMSLDKVDDEATRILMVEFYKNLMSGQSKHQSLKNAQKYLRSVENGKYDDPKYWASFILLDGLN